MTLLDAHLEQISLCAASIAELPFPQPKIFTNALLQHHDITTLIRDTETHERALFSVPPPPPAPKAQDSDRRNTVFNLNGSTSVIGGGGTNAVRAPRRNTAVAAVLGGDLVERIRKGGGGGVGSGLGYSREKSEVDVDILLEGAEKLLGVYPVPGAAEKITLLRQRHSRLVSSIEHYEARVEEQAMQLKRMNKRRDFDDDDDEEEEEEPNDFRTRLQAEPQMTEEDMRREAEEVRELESKKRTLEDRVSALGKDITGVLR
ncbi:DASH complex, subunit Spc34 [Aulographum hederae CBS 113979]|uniref:DASH complex subunit SPC34 n=1 Tax=Aulographum hederae CBS 113979 TaxID=1176131 RepID=A0A6G1GYA3_9PEZI|nr:DASH complex, subunit Spc34 [Aulographum hederae CBS 113979]